ncbi:site-specific recombination directionality factor RDF [Gordonia phage Petra]|uniref:Lipoprotein n=2 Tax=root TaxID=1 RepID=A0A2U8UL66_9CAUD|nr:hypothetical protein [Gordonia westfalica]YP_010095457.1 site-specific recombination directionality factor RDF [Gordonia phage Petra]AWN04176.1 hypothetical protein PBI_PETRA_63 [Gordonia phage Petra]SDU65005.1 hypothetical protein SAMN04488548_1342972 [Gordonia westfalica]
MNTTRKTLAATALAAATVAATLTGCNTDADVADENLKKAAEQFEISRRITVINGITDKYLLVVEGKCSLEFPDGRNEIICKLANGDFVKHHVIKADNVFVMSEQTTGAKVSTDHYRVTFKPETIIPNVDRP